MNYNFEFNSPVIGRIQPFEYSYSTTNEYAFTYGRDIFSDLSKFNAPIFVIRKRRGIFSYDKIYSAIKVKNGFRINEISKQGLKTKKGFNIHDDINASKENNNSHKLDDNYFGEKDILCNIFKQILVEQQEKDINVYNNYFGEKYIPKKITIVNMKTSTKCFSLEKYDDYFLSDLHNKILNIFNNILLETSINKNTNVYKNILLDNSINNFYIYNNFMMSKKDINILNIYNNYFGKTPIKELFINNNFMTSKKDINKIFVYNVINCLKPISNLDIYKQLITKNNKIPKLNIHDYYAIQKNEDYKLYINKKIYNTNIYNKNLFLFKELPVNLISHKTINIQYNKILMSIPNIKINVQYKIPVLARYKKNLIKSRDIVLGYRPNKKVSFRKENLFVYKFDHNLFIKQNILLTKDNHNFDINKTEKNLVLLRKELNIKDVTKFIYKYNKNSVINNVENMLYKGQHDFNISTTEKQLHSLKNGFVINDTNIFIDKARKGFRIDNYTELIYRDRYSMSINIAEADLTKLELPISIIPRNNTIGFMIPEKELYKDNTNQILYFKEKNVFSDDTNIFLNKDSKRTNTELNNIFVITEQRKCFLEYYHNIMLSKNIKTCLLDTDNQLIEKVTKDGIIYDNNVFVVKLNKQIFIENNLALYKNNKDLLKNNENIFLTKLFKKAFLNTDIYLDKKIKTINITNDIWINKESHTTNIFKQNFVSKNIYEAYIVNDNIFIDKIDYKTTLDSYINTKVKERKANINQDTTLTKKEDIANTNDYIFITKKQYEANQYTSEMIYMQKLIKDLEKPVEKTYNWAYVYQYDDPIDPNYEYYGIDELLLPEKDIDYSSFEEIIFNKKTMMPRNPIKIIDDNTFIAKYPIKHPTPDYEEIGIIYIDVPTELMYALFIKFYQIWYANIFKFGNMSMVDSLKLMLDYMYAHIVTTYSGSKYLEPALRVFRQIRWFGETSVMHNAQYKITYEYEDLKSNLQTGKCMIKNELSGFYINKNLKVLSTKSTSIGQDAYIKLYASNREDSQISFSISFTNGNVDVYINDMYIDTIYSNHAFISYDLPATDTENIITLKRSASNNFGSCYIGNIIIKNGTYKNLNIEYDPELKAGNMPLNDVVNKMVILANMYDDEQEAFEQFRKGNLAISELYKRLENYWELHHANKIKGKRLTIKET